MKVARAAVALFCLLAAAQARAGLVITQSVEATVDGKTTTSKHVWSIDDGKFLLTVSGGRGETRYVFNGRTFYACGLLGEAQLAALAKSGVNDPKALDPFRKGACQAVPSNFLVRFFLSPMASAESVDATDGLKLTLAMKDYKLEPGKGHQAVAGHDCADAARSYTLTKSDDEAKTAAAVTAAVREDYCQAPGIDWRQALWTEVAKAVMRQPRGGALLKQLKKDSRALPGFVLKADARQETVDQAGKAHVHAFALKTTSIKKAELAARTFRTPEGFNVFSPESLALRPAASPTAAASGSAKGEASVFDMMRSAFFCAIAGHLGCFAE